MKAPKRANKPEAKAEARHLNRRESKERAGETVLLAVTGMSPAVLTETVWELAKRKQSPVVPDRVVVMTTEKGKEAIEEQLLGPDGIWDALRLAILGKGAKSDDRLYFGKSPDCIKVFTRNVGGRPNPMLDMPSEDDCMAVADFMTDVLWGFASRPDTRLIASIAGGYKSMSALLFACMSLLGRQDDTITHVLIQAPYDDPRLNPRFYFPAQPAQKLADANGETFLASKARITLTEIPFVALGDLLERYEKPRSYSALVHSCRGEVVRIATPEITFDDKQGVVHVGRNEFALHGQEHPLFAFLYERASENLEPFPDHYAAVEPFREFLNQWAPRHVSFSFLDHQRKEEKDWRKSVSNDFFKNPLNRIRKKLAGAGCDVRIVCPHRKLGIVISPLQSN
jgi:CRISPR-associated protein (TIGR02584 family)